MRRIHFLVMPLAGFLMVIGVLTGLPRIYLLYGGADHAIPMLLHERLYPLYDFHSGLIIIGFIATLISFERYAGFQLGRLEWRELLLISIASYLLGTWILLATRLMEIYILPVFPAALYLMGVSSNITHLILTRKYFHRPSLILYIAAYLSLFIAVLNGILYMMLPYLVYATLLISFPILFILGERMELSRYLPHPKPDLPNNLYLVGVAIPFSALFVSADLPSWVFHTAYIASITTLLIILSTGWDGKLILRGFDKHLSIHLGLAYIWLAASIPIYLLSTLYRGVYLTDLSIHLAALGFIGNMLLGHAPLVLKGVLGISMAKTLYATIALNTGILLRIAAAAAGIQGYAVSDVLAFLSGLLVLISIPLTVANIALGARRG